MALYTKFYIISDTHFGHRNMIDYCGRPVDFEEIIFGHLSEISNASNTLIHLGDFCIGHDKQWHDRFLKTFSGRKILIKGNHDRKGLTWYYNNGWDFVCDSFSLNWYGKKILFSHEPQEIRDFDLNIHGHFHNQLPRLLKKEWVVPDEEKRNKNNLSILTDKHKLVALEFNHYSPMLLTNLFK